MSTHDYVFNDSASLFYTIPSDSDDFCGKKKLNFTINSIITNMLVSTNTNGIELRPPTDTLILGKTEVQLLVYLQNFT